MPNLESPNLHEDPIRVEIHLLRKINRVAKTDNGYCLNAVRTSMRQSCDATKVPNSDKMIRDRQHGPLLQQTGVPNMFFLLLVQSTLRIYSAVPFSRFAIVAPIVCTVCPFIEKLFWQVFISLQYWQKQSVSCRRKKSPNGRLKMALLDSLWKCIATVVVLWLECKDVRKEILLRMYSSEFLQPLALRIRLQFKCIHNHWYSQQ